MAELRTEARRDPARALELADEGNRRFAASSAQAERAALVVEALYRLGRPSEGRAAAETMVNTFAGTEWAHEVEAHTGAHPRVNR